MRREEKKRTSKRKGSRTQTRGPVRRKIAASCAAAGVALVLEAAPGCGSSNPPKVDTPVYAILPPQKDARVDGTRRDGQVFAIMPPPDARVDGQAYIILPPPPPPKDARVDGQFYAILPPPKQG